MSYHCLPASLRMALSTAAAIWRDIEKTPESIAFEGIKFLKKSLAAAA